ncbi:MAG: hypothetical protein ACRDJE_04835 [Dehalococcoidia bacterium]
MRTKSLTVTVRADETLQRQLRKAADRRGQSLTAFVEGAAEELARRILLEWAIDRYIEGNHSFGELAEETGMNVEEIMTAMEGVGDRDRAAALAAMWGRTRDDGSDMFLTAAASIARINDDSSFLQHAERVAARAPVTERHPEDIAGA